MQNSLTVPYSRGLDLVVSLLLHDSFQYWHRNEAPNAALLRRFPAICHDQNEMMEQIHKHEYPWHQPSLIAAVLAGLQIFVDAR